MARPRIEIDRVEFEKLCALQCSEEEIADWFNCSVDTIERWCKRTYSEGFAEVFSKKRGRGKIALRRAQFKLAEKSAAMSIFLGKNYLGQHDRQEVAAVNMGQLDDLIDGLKEPIYELKEPSNDIYAETKNDDGAVEDKQA